MTSSMSTILIIGGTAGIGAAFAERFHSHGKKVIITGRNEEKLANLKSSFAGIETHSLDMTKLDKLGDDLAYLLKTYPNIDTVWINGGIQYTSNIKDASTSSDEKIQNEMATNVIAPMIIGRHVVPLLLAKKTETTLMFTSSGLGFMPLPAFPVYCATKAAVHHYCVGLRQALKDSSLHVLELAPPYVETGLDAAHKEVASKAHCMPLKEYVDEAFRIMDGKLSKELKEIAVGFAGAGAGLWRGSIGKKMTELGLSD